MAFVSQIKAFALIVVACLLLAGCAGPSSSDGDSVENRGSDTDKWWEKLPRSEWANHERVLLEIEWFEVYRVAPATYAIYEPGQFEEVISFLIVGSEKAILFDSGLGLVPLKPVIDRLTDKELITINSHSHYDHVGGNHEFGPIASIDHEWTKARSKGMANDKVGEFVKGDWLPKPPSTSFNPDAFEIKPWTLGDILRDGDVIDLGGRAITVLETPGHAPDALCLLDEGNRLLFTGDTFYLAPLYAHLEGSDFEAYHATVRRLAALKPKVDHLMTSHNVPKVDAHYLEKLSDAFQKVADKSAEAVATDGALEYQFDGFSIIAPETAGEASQ